MMSWNWVKSNCDVIANFPLIFRNSEYLMKIKFPSYVTRKFYLYLITLKFLQFTARVLQLRHLSSIKNSEWLHWKNHLNLCSKFSANNCDLPEFLGFFLISLLISKTVFRKTITVRSKDIISVQLKGLLTGNVFY